MTTANEIIAGALSKIEALGVGETPAAEDADTCLKALNALVDSWNLDPSQAYRTEQVTATLPSSTAYLTIGAAQSLSTARPIRIERGSFVTVGGIDYPLDPVDITEYNGIALKSTSGPWPSVCAYDGGLPTGRVYFWPLGACTVSLTVRTLMTEFAGLTTSYTLPPGLKRALIHNLGIEVAPDFGATPSADLRRLAVTSRKSFMRANSRVPQLEVRGPAPVHTFNFQSGQ